MMDKSDVYKRSWKRIKDNIFIFIFDLLVFFLPLSLVKIDIFDLVSKDTVFNVYIEISRV